MRDRTTSLVPREDGPRPDDCVLVVALSQSLDFFFDAELLLFEFGNSDGVTRRSLEFQMKIAFKLTMAFAQLSEVRFNGHLQFPGS